MKKKSLLIVCLLLVVVVAAVAFAACDGTGGKKGKAQLVEIKGGTIDGKEAKLEVAEDVKELNGVPLVKVSDGATWALLKEKGSEYEEVTKQLIKLSDGENKFRIVVNSENEKESNTYNFTVFKNFTTKIYFRYLNRELIEEKEVKSHTALSDRAAPTAKPLGCATFTGWKTAEGDALNGYNVEKKNISFYANYTATAEMANLVFTSSPTECKVLGVADSSVKSIVVPDVVTEIKISAFESCKNLEKITLPFIGLSREKSEYYSKLSSIFSDINYPEKLAEVEITEGITEVNDGAFTHIYSLKKVILPEGVTRIGKEAFSSCYNLQEVSLPSSLEVIGAEAFQWCKSLNQITLGENIKAVATNAFVDCYNLVEVCNKTSVALTLGSNALGGVAKYAQNICADESEFKLQKTADGFTIYENKLVGYIGNDEIITLPDSVTEINREAFSNNLTIKKVIIPANIVKIGESAFQKCNSLEEVWISKSVKEVDSFIFCWCKKIKIINLEAETAPSGWDGLWNDFCDAAIKYGVTLEEWQK